MDILLTKNKHLEYWKVMDVFAVCKSPYW